MPHVVGSATVEVARGFHRYGFDALRTVSIVASARRTRPSGGGAVSAHPAAAAAACGGGSAAFCGGTGGTGGTVRAGKRGAVPTDTRNALGAPGAVQRGRYVNDRRRPALPGGGDRTARS